MYKVICSDLDGTLLDKESELSVENSLAIEKIAEKGYLFVPATGRTYEEIPEAVRNHKSIRYFIYSNGSVIYDKLLNKRYEIAIEHEKILEIIDALKDYDLLHLIHADGRGIIDKDRFERVEQFQVWRLYLKLLNSFPDKYRVENFLEYFKGLEKMEMLVTFFRRDNDLEEICRERLSKIEGIHVTSSSSGNIEIVNINANKGNAIHRFASLLGIDSSEIITVGDSPNDIEMLKAAGMSLAVSGARDEVKSAATKVICSNDENVAEYILENILN